ncbi:MoaD/ThiS family protein, partial [Candidatus Bipolaricaulota bacterium]
MTAMNLDSNEKQISITVKVFGGLRESFDGGTRSRHLPFRATLSVLLDGLESDYPDLATKLTAGINAGYLNTLINGRNVQFLQGQD